MGNAFHVIIDLTNLGQSDLMLFTVLLLEFCQDVDIGHGFSVSRPSDDTCSVILGLVSLRVGSLSFGSHSEIISGNFSIPNLLVM